MLLVSHFCALNAHHCIIIITGPNINPACPPPGYYYEVKHSNEPAGERSGSAAIGDVAGEEVVGVDCDEVTTTSDSGQVSETQSVGKPKKGMVLFY